MPRAVPIMAGTGANSTQEAIEHSRYAAKVGADCTLSVVLLQQALAGGHLPALRAIAEAADIPMVLYNVPGRTVADMQPETVLRPAQVPGIVGIKEASGNIERAAHLIKHAPPGFDLLGRRRHGHCADAARRHGNVSVTANVAPRAMHELCVAALEGRVREATAIHLRLLELHGALFVEPSPAPTKWALQRLGRCGGG